METQILYRAWAWINLGRWENVPIDFFIPLDEKRPFDPEKLLYPERFSDPDRSPESIQEEFDPYVGRVANAFTKEEVDQLVAFMANQGVKVETCELELPTSEWLYESWGEEGSGVRDYLDLDGDFGFEYTLPFKVRILYDLENEQVIDIVNRDKIRHFLATNIVEMGKDSDLTPISNIFLKYLDLSGFQEEIHFSHDNPIILNRSDLGQ